MVQVRLAGLDNVPPEVRAELVATRDAANAEFERLAPRGGIAGD